MSEDPLVGTPTEAVQTVSIEDAKELIAARGREKGFVTSDDLLEGLPVEDLTPEQVEEFLTQVEDHLRQEGIEVIEVPGEEIAEGDGEVVTRLPREDELLKAPTNDPVRM
ncbi:MAG TPA: RNA polymerase sigma factor region1.1 domain-containing protein, partial [Actinomycetota bacterium]|nr:RNA polymerase sigma factor region1.1 domain-containing protein [Actinomycetota bacterium]